jgi:hypothetical protein
VGAAVIIPGTTRADVKNSLRTRPGGTTGSSPGCRPVPGRRLRDMRWLDPTDVADRVIDAMARGDRLVVTHPE